MQFKEYQNGDWYFGEQKDQHKHGVGLFVHPGNLLFVGEWSEGKPGNCGLRINKTTKVFTDEAEKFYVEKVHNQKFDYLIYKKLTNGQKYGYFKRGKEFIRGYFQPKVSLTSNQPIEGLLVVSDENSIKKGKFTESGLSGVGELETNFEHYFGEFEHGFKHGIGYSRNYIRKTNTIAVFNNNEIGDTSIEFHNHNITIRHCDSGKLEGFIHYSDGQMYIGELLQSKRSGGSNQRVDTPSDSSVTQRHGFGCLFKKSGDYYMGGWEFGKKSGIGLETVFEEEKANQQERFERYNYYGHFQDNQKNGFGILEAENKKTFEAEFKDGKMTSIVRVTDLLADARNNVKYFQYHENNCLKELGQREAASFAKIKERAGLFNKGDFQEYAYSRLNKMESAIRTKKNEVLRKFVTLSKSLRQKYKIFDKINSDHLPFMEQKKRLLNLIDKFRQSLFHHSMNNQIKAILIDPVSYLIQGIPNMKALEQKMTQTGKLSTQNLTRTQQTNFNHLGPILINQLLESQVHSTQVNCSPEFQESFVTKFANTVNIGHVKTQNLPMNFKEKAQTVNVGNLAKSQPKSKSPVRVTHRSKSLKGSPGVSKQMKTQNPNESYQVPDYFKKLLQKNTTDKFDPTLLQDSPKMKPTKVDDTEKSPKPSLTSVRSKTPSKYHVMSAKNLKSEKLINPATVKVQEDDLLSIGNSNPLASKQQSNIKESQKSPLAMPTNGRSPTNASPLLSQGASGNDFKFLSNFDPQMNRMSLSGKNAKSSGGLHISGSDLRNTNLMSTHKHKSIDVDKINFIKINNIKIDTSKISGEQAQPYPDVKFDTIDHHNPINNMSVNSNVTLNNIVRNLSTGANELRDSSPNHKKHQTGFNDNFDKNSGLQKNLMSIEELNEDQENQDQLLSTFKSKVDYDMGDYLDNIEQNLMDQFLSVDKPT